jgi:hypothetical protein
MSHVEVTMADDELLLPWAEEKKDDEAVPRAPEAAPAEEKVLSVSEVNRLAKQCLETMTVSVQGEVSKLTTGYAYYV